MDALLIAIAFFFGLLAHLIGLPPMVGFLVSGFALHALGQEGGGALEIISDFGVTLMLFTIGLKLRLRSLLRPEIWAGTTLHVLGTVALFGLVFWACSHLDVPLLGGLGGRACLLLAFALSFSSTVFAVKMLEENSELGALHGRITVGILIMQDLLAVLYLTASSGKIPSAWSIGLLAGLIAVRPALVWLVSRSGHGELIMLCGLFFAVVLGAKGFESVGLKADLGALFVGAVVGQHPKAKELAKSLLGLTDLLLVGFFLTIGLNGLPGWHGIVVAAFLVTLLPFKAALFFALLTRFRFRARTASMSGLNLATYGEFGLIVIALAVANAWIPGDWLVVAAITLSLSFIAAAPLTRRAEAVYDRLNLWLHRYETAGRHPDDLPVRTQGQRIAVFGMGRVGLAAYNVLQNRFPGNVIGFDLDPAKVQEHRDAGRNVVLADATDSDFWHRVRPKDDIDLAVLAMPKHSANLHAIETLKRLGYEGVVAATARFDDDVKQLRALGVHTAFDLYSEAGTGFGHHICGVLAQHRPDLVSHIRMPATAQKPG